MPYARVEGGIAVLYENEWYLCTQKDEEAGLAAERSRSIRSLHEKAESLFVRRYVPLHETSGGTAENH